MVASCIMAWRAAAWATAQGKWAWLGPIGSILFMCSDSFIAVDKFLGSFEGRGVAVMFTYWLAQRAHHG